MPVSYRNTAVLSPAHRITERVCIGCTLHFIKKWLKIMCKNDNTEKKVLREVFRPQSGGWIEDILKKCHFSKGGGKPALGF